MQSLSVFVTTYNNADTLDACLTSVAFADEVLVLDSFSTDATPEICDRHGVRFVQHAFLGYGRQKQLALEHTVHEWVLFLDADGKIVKRWSFPSPERRILPNQIVKFATEIRNPPSDAERIDVGLDVN